MFGLRLITSLTLWSYTNGQMQASYFYLPTGKAQLLISITCELNRFVTRTMNFYVKIHEAHITYTCRNAITL